MAWHPPSLKQRILVCFGGNSTLAGLYFKLNGRADGNMWSVFGEVSSYTPPFDGRLVLVSWRNQLGDATSILTVGTSEGPFDLTAIGKKGWRAVNRQVGINTGVYCIAGVGTQTGRTNIGFILEPD